jgi:hypothetical protein
MSSSQMRVEDRLVGARKWSPWMSKIVLDLELWDIFETIVRVPPDTTHVLLADFRKRKNKEKRIICDAV